jgi:hypothetical protein
MCSMLDGVWYLPGQRLMESGPLSLAFFIQMRTMASLVYLHKAMTFFLGHEIVCGPCRNLCFIHHLIFYKTEILFLKKWSINQSVRDHISQVLPHNCGVVPSNSISHPCPQSLLILCSFIRVISTWFNIHHCWFCWVCLGSLPFTSYAVSSFTALSP